MPTNIITRVRDWLRRPGRWQALLFGQLAALGFAPLTLFPLFIVALAWLCHAWRQPEATPRRGFWLGWWWGFGLFTGGLYWIAFALTVDLATYGWLLPPAIFGIPAVLAFYIAGSGWLFSRYRALSLPWLLPVLWVGIEVVRGTLILPFPWLFAGYVWTDFLPALQVTSLVGIYGLSFLTVWLAASLAVYRADKRHGLASVALFIALCLWGAWRLGQPVALHETTIRLVQPNIAQTLKWDMDLAQQHWQTMLRLSATPADPAPNLIIWPEASAPFPLQRYPELLKQLPGGDNTAYVIGNTRRLAPKELANSLVLVEGQRIAHIYDKKHLVPFGEYVPLADILPLDSITGGGSRFMPGPGAQTVPLAGHGLSPLICYEVLFSGQVTADVRPDMLINSTNDAWYGHTSGPYQHLAQSRVRSVEEGVPLLRSANTGISALVDPYGRPVASLPLGQQGVVDAPLPQALPPTVFSRAGYWPLAALMLLFVIAGRWRAGLRG